MRPFQTPKSLWYAPPSLSQKGNKAGILERDSNRFLPGYARHIAPLHGQEELLLLEGEDAHLAMGPRSRLLLSHAVDAVTLKRTEKNRI